MYYHLAIHGAPKFSFRGTKNLSSAEDEVDRVAILLFLLLADYSRRSRPLPNLFLELLGLVLVALVRERMHRRVPNPLKWWGKKGAAQSEEVGSGSMPILPRRREKSASSGFQA